MKKYVDYLSTIPATVVSGVFLLLSLIFSHIQIIPSFIPDMAWISVIISGTPLLFYAVYELIKEKGVQRITSSMLVSIAMIAAIVIGDLFAAGEVAFIMAIGEILEDKTTERAKKGLKNLISLAPTQGRRLNGNTEELIPVENIEKGNILRILPGEKIPVDGIIINGQTSVDQSIMTGESMPVDKEIGDEVFCGTINCFGSIDIEAKKVGEDSSLQKLIKLVKDAENQQAPMQRTADKWASILVPAALVVAVILGIMKQSIEVAVTVLVVFCPCAMVLATPTAIMAAIGQATKNGVIIKSGAALEKMSKVNIIAFDKTGTLTHGKLEVSEVISLNKNINNNQLLILAGAAESKSEHPLGKAVTYSARKITEKLPESENFKMLTGKGISATINNMKILCGNEKFLKENNITIPTTINEKITSLRKLGMPLILVADEKNVLGIITLSDSLRNNAKQTIDSLKSNKVNSLLLTGDNKEIADFFAKKVGIENVYSELIPEEKLKQITHLQDNNNIVCMVGDGVNDAPALKVSDVGVAMGAMGSDIAVEAADIALMNDDFSKISYLKKLSVASVRTIKLSIAISLFINFAAIILSYFELLNPTTGALVHNVGSVLVVLFAALLYDRKIK